MIFGFPRADRGFRPRRGLPEIVRSGSEPETATTRRSGSFSAAGELPRAPLRMSYPRVTPASDLATPLPANGGARGTRTPAGELPRPRPFAVVRDTLPLQRPADPHCRRPCDGVTTSVTSSRCRKSSRAAVRSYAASLSPGGSAAATAAPAEGLGVRGSRTPVASGLSSPKPRGSGSLPAARMRLRCGRNKTTQSATNAMATTATATVPMTRL